MKQPIAYRGVKGLRDLRKDSGTQGPGTAGSRYSAGTVAARTHPGLRPEEGRREGKDALTPFSLQRLKFCPTSHWPNSAGRRR